MTYNLLWQPFECLHSYITVYSLFSINVNDDDDVSAFICHPKLTHFGSYILIANNITYMYLF